MWCACSPPTEVLLLLRQVDSNSCKMVYEDNEDEYDDFYEYSALDCEDDAEGQLFMFSSQPQQETLAMP